PRIAVLRSHPVSLCPCVSLLFLCLFFLILRPPPSSTLFPYTTLFRSQRVPVADRSLDERGGAVREPGEHLAIGGRSRRPEQRDLDRKSTRLNSSHDQISYAVFCLKKKKKRKNNKKNKRKENRTQTSHV